jgi:PadR family transcriptional regulator, regulatory protein AphA
MSLDHAILGFLNYDMPLSGYDLKKTLDGSVAHFWPADQSQIYRTLARLTKQDYVDVEFIAQQQDRPNRKVYHITDKGRKEICRWVAEERSKEVFRKPFLVQSFFAGMLNDEQVLEIFEARAQELRDLQARFEALAKDVAEGKGHEGPPREQFFWYLTLDNGLWEVQAKLEWVEDTIGRIKRKEYEQGGRVLPPPRRKR